MKRMLLGLLVIVAAVLFVSRNGIMEKFPFGGRQVSETERDSETTEAELVKVVDGDTIDVIFDGVQERVRLIGIDTPESVHPDEGRNSNAGKEASRFLSKLLRSTDTVYIELDVQARDKYNRMLAYVYWYNNGEWTMLNRCIIQEGYAQALTIPPNVRYESLFLKDQKQAQKNKRGLWTEN